MKRFFTIIILIVVSLIVTNLISQGARLGHNSGDIAPDFTLQDINGKKVSLKSLRKSKLVLIDFWSGWCASCKEDVPLLNKIYSEYNFKGIKVVGVNFKDNPLKVKNFIAKYKVKYPVLIDPTGEITMGKYKILGLPTTIILNSKGVILFRGTAPPKQYKKFFDGYL